MERIKQKPDEARKQRENIQRGYVSSAHPAHEIDAFNYRKGVITGLKRNKTRLVSVAAAIIIPIAMLLWWGGHENQPHIERLSDIDIDESRQAIVAMGTTVEMMNNKIASLAAQMDDLSESIVQLETRLISTRLTMDALVATNEQPTAASGDKQETILIRAEAPETLPAPASGQSGTETSVTKPSRSETTQIAPESPSNLAAASSQRTAEHKLPTAEARTKGLWVINLVSTSSEADAQRLSKNALSKNIHTELQQITVKGTKYWRVQLTGFHTSDDAKAYAEIAKKQLGLKDAWIMKR